MPAKPRAPEPPPDYVPLTAVDMNRERIEAYFYQGSIFWAHDDDPRPADAVPLYVKADRT